MEYNFMRKQCGFSFVEIMISVTIMTVLGLMLMTAVSKRFLVAGVNTDNGGVFYCYKDVAGNLHSRTERIALDGSKDIQEGNTCQLEIDGISNISITAIGGGGGGAFVSDAWMEDQNVVLMKNHEGEIIGGETVKFIDKLDVDGGTVTPDFNPDLEMGELKNETILQKAQGQSVARGLYGGVTECVGSGCVPLNTLGTERGEFVDPFLFAVNIPSVDAAGVCSCDKNGDGLCNKSDNITYFRTPLGFNEEIDGDALVYQLGEEEDGEDSDSDKLNSCIASDNLVKNLLSDMYTDRAYNKAVLTNYWTEVKGGGKNNSELLNLDTLRVGCKYILYDGLPSKSRDEYNISGDGGVVRSYKNIVFFPTYGVANVACDGSDFGDPKIAKASSEQFDAFTTKGYTTYSAVITDELTDASKYDMSDEALEINVRNSYIYNLKYYWLLAEQVRAPIGESGAKGETTNPLTIRGAVDFEISINAESIGIGGAMGTAAQPKGANGGRTVVRTPLGVLSANGGLGGDAKVAIDETRPGWQAVSFSTASPMVDYNSGYTVINNSDVFISAGQLPSEPERSSWFDNAANPVIEDSNAATISYWDTETSSWVGGEAPGAASFGAGGAGMQTRISVQKLLGVLNYRLYGNSVNNSEDYFFSRVYKPTLERNTSHNGNGGGGAVIIHWTR